MKKIVVIGLSILACGCSSRYASNGEHLYLNSRSGATLVVPPPLTEANISHFYDLPRQDQKAEVDIVPPSDPALGKEIT